MKTTSWVHSRTRGNQQKLEHGKFLTRDNENVFNVKVVKQSTRLLRDMVEFTSLELFKTQHSPEQPHLAGPALSRGLD